MFPGLTGTNRSDTLIELLAGIFGYGLIGELVILICFPDGRFSYSVGWCIGVLTAMACGYHMWWGLDRALDLGEKDAVKLITTYNLLRYGVIVVIMGVVMVTEFGNPLAAVFGVLGLKAGAYLQPLFHKFSKHALQQENVSADRMHENTGEEVLEEKEVSI